MRQSVVVLIVVYVQVCLCRSDGDYWEIRKRLIKNENALAVGSNLQLSDKEESVNKLLMSMKNEEMDDAFKNPASFPPARHFFQTRRLVHRSKVFEFIRKMPKGGALHVHDTSLSTENYLLKNVTYREHLYMCNSSDIRFRFFDPPPKEPCWTLVRKVRENDSYFDAWLKPKFTLITEHPMETYPDVNSIWIAFRKIFERVTPLLCFRPIFEEYFYHALVQFRKDNVNYMEIRGTLPQLYELNGTTYDTVQVLGILKAVSDKFLKNHPDFLGIKYIYAPLRLVSNATMDEYLQNFRKMRQLYPDFLVGFDLVGQEDSGKPLASFINQLLQVDKSTKFFFHAGETKWSGMPTDLNLIDAVLLNATRIGHGYALTKHPLVLKLIKNRQIAVEINPISNQVLNLVKDLRNHPGNFLISQNYPVVISSDDPGYWGAEGLSYDFYMAFMGLANKNTDLRLLKQLALNSLLYSSLESDNKRKTLSRFSIIWNKFIDSILHENTYNYEAFFI